MIKWVKEHPWLTGGLVLGAIVLYYLWKNRGSGGASASNAGIPVGGGYYPSYSGSAAAASGGGGIMTSSPAPTAAAAFQTPPVGADIGAATVHASDGITVSDHVGAAHVAPTGGDPHGLADYWANFVSPMKQGAGPDPTRGVSLVPITQAPSGVGAGSYSDAYGVKFTYNPNVYSGGYNTQGTTGYIGVPGVSGPYLLPGDPGYNASLPGAGCIPRATGGCQ